MTMPLSLDAASAGGGDWRSEDSGPREEFAATLATAVDQRRSTDAGPAAIVNRPHRDNPRPDRPDRRHDPRDDSRHESPGETSDVRSAPHHIAQTEPVDTARDVASEMVETLHELAVGVAALERAGQALSGQIAAQLAAAQRQPMTVDSAKTAATAGVADVAAIGAGAGPPTLAGQFAQLITAATAQPNGAGGPDEPGEATGPVAPGQTVGPGAPGEAVGPGAPGEAGEAGGPGGPGAPGEAGGPGGPAVPGVGNGPGGTGTTPPVIPPVANPITGAIIQPTPVKPAKPDQLFNPLNQVGDAHITVDAVEATGPGKRHAQQGSDSQTPDETPAFVIGPAAPAPTAAVADASVVTAVSQPALPTPAEQIAMRLVPLRRGPDGVHRMTIHLSPEDLGPISIVAEVRGGAIAVQLHSTTEAGRAALQASLPDLRQDLVDGGFGSCALDLQQGEFSQNQPQPNWSQPERRPAPANIVVPEFAEALDDPVATGASQSALDLRV